MPTREQEEWANATKATPGICPTLAEVHETHSRMYPVSDEPVQNPQGISSAAPGSDDLTSGVVFRSEEEWGRIIDHYRSSSASDLNQTTLENHEASVTRDLLNRSYGE